MLAFFCPSTAPPEIYTLSLHDALPIYTPRARVDRPRGHAPGSADQAAPTDPAPAPPPAGVPARSEEHTSELQSHSDLVCRLLLEKKKRAPAAHLPTPQTHGLARKRYAT